VTGADRALLLTPGASATRDHPALVAIDRALAGDGVAVERIDLPRSRRPEALIDAVASAAAGLAARAGVGPGRVVLGGRSMGGRMCSMAVAGGAVPAALGLALVSYPLHPPGRPDRARVEHLPAITVPCLFVSGTRDAFGTPAELEAAAATVAGPVTHVWIEGGDHGLRGRDAEVAAAVREWVLAQPPG
jgi:uncharacterized protein